MPAPPNRSKIDSVQYLRALAALLVVFSHAHDQLRVPMPYRPQLGHIGVDLFFVISGFIMVTISAGKERSPEDFMADRAKRIVPIYWLYTGIVAALAIVLPSIFRGTTFEPWHFLRSLFFVAHVGPEGGTSPMLRLGWTLNYEMLFYSLFALGMVLRAREAFSAGAIIALVVAGWVIAPANPVAQFYTGSIMLEFVMGMAVALLWLRRGVPPVLRWALLPAIALALAWANAFDWKDYERGLLYGPFAAAILVCALAWQVKRETMVHRVMRKLGDASYTIYLFHLFPLAALRLAWKAAGLPLTQAGNVAFVALSMVVVCVTGYIAYLLTEKPIAEAFAARARKPLPA